LIPPIAKVAIVTGGGRGIGRSIARALAIDGFDIALTYHMRREAAEDSASEIRRLGRKAFVSRVQVSEASDVRRFVAEVTDVFNRVDVLVNNAGMLEQKPFAAITEQEWDNMMAVNLRSGFLCSHEVLPIMLRRASGSIVNIASSGGQLGGTLAVHYAASKAGVISLTRSLARIAAAGGVRVNCVAPGLIETEMTADEIASPAGRQKIDQQILLKRAGRAEEVASAVAFLVSENAAYITGHTLNVNGGLYMGEG
jgi:3-oxoacyl-[acyl-carrier protein] reductase